MNDRPLLSKVATEELSKLLSQPNANPDNIPVLYEEEIFTFLNSNVGRTEIQKARTMLNHLGMHSIPKFIIEGTTLIDGAADWTVFVDVFHEIEERGEVQNGGKSIFGDILGVDPELVQRGAFSSVEDLKAA